MRLPHWIRRAYENDESAEEFPLDVTSVLPRDTIVIATAVETINKRGSFDSFKDYLVKTPEVGRALLRTLKSLERGEAIERLAVAMATVLASILVTSPSSLVNYTSAYRRLDSDGYTFDEDKVAAQDSLVQDCLLALAARPIDQQKRRTGLHGHDAAFKLAFTPLGERDSWYYPKPELYPLSIPVPLTLSNHSTVYTCGDRPNPLPSVGQQLYADDSLMWTHQSRFWSYPCWGKHWSAAKTPNECTRFVIALKAGLRIECYPMDMSTSSFSNEVHIIEAPIHLGAYLDSLVLYNENGITVNVTSVRDDIVDETYTSEVQCELVQDSSQNTQTTL